MRHLHAVAAITLICLCCLMGCKSAPKVVAFDPVKGDTPNSIPDAIEANARADTYVGVSVDLQKDTLGKLNGTARAFIAKSIEYAEAGIEQIRVERDKADMIQKESDQKDELLARANLHGYELEKRANEAIEQGRRDYADLRHDPWVATALWLKWKVYWAIGIYLGLNLVAFIAGLVSASPVSIFSRLSIFLVRLIPFGFVGAWRNKYRAAQKWPAL